MYLLPGIFSIIYIYIVIQDLVLKNKITRANHEKLRNTKSGMNKIFFVLNIFETNIFSEGLIIFILLNYTMTY